MHTQDEILQFLQEFEAGTPALLARCAGDCLVISNILILFLGMGRLRPHAGEYLSVRAVVVGVGARAPWLPALLQDHAVAFMGDLAELVEATSIAGTV